MWVDGLRKYRLSRCFPNIAMKVASSEIGRLVYMSPVTVTISLGGYPWAGGMTGGEEGCRLLVRIGLEVRMGVDDEGRADRTEQTRLRGRVRQGARVDGGQCTKIKAISYSMASLYIS
jgi:hypothetical protein